MKESKKIIQDPKYHIQKINWGAWFDWGYFKCRAYKKGTMHLEFKDEKLWASFNARVAKLRGYPLPEQKAQTTYQKRHNGHKEPVRPQSKKAPYKPVILATIKVPTMG